MNDYEMTLVAALRAEAEEIAMTIDHKQATDELESRMDDADRARRGTYWAAAAAAVVVIGGAALLSGNWTGDSPESLPGGNNTTDHAATGITYTSNLTAMPFTVTLPPWLLENDVRQAEVHSHAIYWDSEWCATSREVNCTTGGLGLRIAIPRAIYRPGTEGPQPVPDFQGYLSFLNSLETTSSLRITDRASATVDGLPAEVMTLTPIYQAVDARF